MNWVPHEAYGIVPGLFLVYHNLNQRVGIVGKHLRISYYEDELDRS